MAIRLRHDVAALGASLASGGSERRKYGQQLVQQQRKYDMEQMQAMQDRAFDMQKQGMQNAWQMNRDLQQNEMENARMLKAANINETARAREDARRAAQEREARNLGLQDMDRQNRMANFEQGRAAITSMAQNALQKGNLPVDLQKKISDLMVARTSVLMDPKWDEPQRQQFLQDYNSQLTALMGQVPPEAPAFEQANQNLRYYDPRSGKYAATFEPGVGMEVYDPETKMRWQDSSGQQQAPISAQDFYRSNPDRFEKDLANEMSVLRDKVESGEAKFFESEDAMRQAAWDRMQNAYNFRQTTLGAGPGMAPVGQSGAPGSVQRAPAVPVGAPGVAAPAGPVQQQGVPQSTRTAIDDVLASFPSTEAMAMSGADKGSMIEAGMPQGTASSLATASSVGASTSPQAFSVSEAAKVFESGTPEQKMQIRNQMSDEMQLSDLLAQEAMGNAEASKVLDMLRQDPSPSEVILSAKEIAKNGKVADVTSVIEKIQTMRDSGKIDDVDFATAVVSSSGKSAKDMYAEIRGFKSYKDMFGNTREQKEDKLKGGPRTEAVVLNQIWEDMGMFDNRSVVRAFESTPSFSQVADEVSKRGGMSKADAEEWLYNQILARKYSGQLQKRLESELSSGLQERKIQEKRSSWTPNKKQMSKG